MMLAVRLCLLVPPSDPASRSDLNLESVILRLRQETCWDPPVKDLVNKFFIKDVFFHS